MAKIARMPGTKSMDTEQLQYQELRSRLHSELLNRLNLERLSQIGRQEAEPEIRDVIADMLEDDFQSTPLSLFERENLFTDILNELFGLGPLEELLQDSEISDILVNKYNQIYIERNGVLETADAVFKDDHHLMTPIERIVSAVGRRIDAGSSHPSCNYFRQ